MVSWLRVVVVCSILVGGCSSTADPSTATGAATSFTTTAFPAQTAPTTTSTPPQATTAQQEIAPKGTTTTATTGPARVSEAAVSAALVEYLPAELASVNFGGKAFCGHYLHGIEQQGNRVSAYISGWCHEYYIEAGLMELGTVQGIHARIDLKVGADGLSAYAHEQAAENEEDDSGLFPDWVLDAMRGQQPPIIPDQPLTQAVAHFGATPERVLASGATCAEVSSFNPLYEYGVLYWLRDGRPAALDPDGDGRPCEDEYAPHLVEMYWEPMRFPLEGGLLCRDLDAMGLPLGDAVAYWLREQRPDRMDADRNGIPCETVYGQDDFDGFYSAVADEEPGQTCCDLATSGYRFDDALAYWFMEGTPDRMDADGNGVPCETVYDPMEVSSHLWFVDQELEPGLFCRDFTGMGGFATAVRYWMHNGMPDRMDDDGDGIPCETVFDQFDIDTWLEFDRIWRVG